MKKNLLNLATTIRSIKSNANTLRILSFFVFSLFFANTSFAKFRVNNVTIATQTGSATYGTATTGSISFNITLDETNPSGGQQNDKFTISWPNGTPTGVTTSIGTGLTFTPTGDNQVITITINTTAATPAGSFTFRIATQELNGGNPGNATGTLTISQKQITVSGLTAANKTYNGNANATISGTAAFAGLAAGDAGRVGYSTTGAFQSANVGTTIPVTVTLTGTAAGNYVLTTTLSANITAKALTITTPDANNKTYDGTTIAVVTGALSGVVAGDNVTLAGNGTFATANIGNNIPVTSNSTLSGADAGNYTLTQPTGILANITAKALTITGLSVPNKVYDGTTAATLNGTATLNGVAAADAGNVVLGGTPTAAFSNANAGNNKTVTVTGYSLSGSAIGNYTFSQPTFTANITTRPITITATGLSATKNYGVVQPILNNSTNFAITAGTLVTGESVTTVTLTPDVTPFFNLNAYTPAGSNYQYIPSNAAGTNFNANNYNITYINFTGVVVQEPITITATGPATKAYGTALTFTNNSTANFSITSGALAPGETITVDLTPTGAGTAATAPAGTSYTITPSGATTTLLFIQTTNNYAITYVPFTTGTITQANLSITANAVSKPLGATLPTPVTGSTAFSSTGLVNGETIGSVTIAYGAASAAAATVGTYNNQVTPSDATGGTFNASNYNITYNAGTLTVVAGVYDWTGAISTDWYTPQNWSVSGVQQTSNYPGLNGTTDAVRIGVVAYTNTANQPALSSTLTNTIASLTIGNTEASTLTLNASTTLNLSGSATFNTGSNFTLNGASGSSLIIGGDYTTATGATFNNNSSATITISGIFTNGGTSNFGSSLLTFNNTGSAIQFTTTGTQLFTNVVFANGHYLLKKPGGPGSAQFNIAAGGTLTLANGVNLTIASATLTLLSDATGSAAVAPVPSGCQINGPVNVQRYMQANRGYRLMASPVNAGTDANSNYVYSVNYLKSSTYLTGTTGTAGLFDKGGNPTLYIYREDITPNGSSFLTSGYRGISDLTGGNNTPPSYSLNLDASGVNIPVSNGYLFYYRGSRNQKTLAQLTTAGAAATNDTLTASGTLNVGQIIFRDWNNPGSTSLSYSNSDPTLIGFNLAGNPYASSIDWDTYNTTSPATGIYTQNLSDFVYELNPTTQNYDIYEAGGATSTNQASRTIVSGQGFFVLAKGADAQLIFNESAKNTTLQNTGQKLYMGKPNAMAANNQFLKLQIAADTINKDDIVIAFNNNAKPSFDLTEDAPYKTGSGKVNLASLSSDKKLLAINRMPLQEKVVTIPLKIGATAQGTYSLNMSSIQGVPMLYDIWLMDAYRKDSVDMRHNKSYLFDVSFADTNTYGAHRFTLIMRQNPALAYHLLNFTASKEAGRQVQINWVAENEANYTNFTVERSTDEGKTYDIIANVPATGAGAYGLLDKNPGENNLYRLKQQDFNNNIAYSHVIPVGFANQSNSLAGNNINIYPNPAGSTVNMAIKTAVNDKAATYNFTITNTYGLVMKQGTSAQTNWETNVSDLLPGTYVIQVINNTDKSFVGKSKLVKL